MCERRLALRLLLWIVVLGLAVWTVSPAAALWLPWASEENKVKKALTDVFQALVSNDRRTLSELVKGNAVQRFIDQEQNQIKSLGVKQYECRITRINLDDVGKSWAFVEYEKTATLSNGEKMTSAASSVFQKIEGDWRLLTGVRGKLSTARKARAERGRAVNQ